MHREKIRKVNLNEVLVLLVVRTKANNRNAKRRNKRGGTNENFENAMEEKKLHNVFFFY